MMTTTCYIAQDRNYLTHNLDKACCDGRRYFQGERDLITLDRGVLDGLVAERKPSRSHGSSQVINSPALAETIWRDISEGATQGSYDRHARPMTPKRGGYLVGGGRTAVCILPDKRTEQLNLTCQAEIDNALLFLMNAQNHMKRAGIGGVSFWIRRGRLFFELTDCIFNREQAVRIAFEKRNEYALFDVANQVEVFNQDKLHIQKTAGDVFARFKQHTYEYRHAMLAEKLFMEQTWYRAKTFKGFI